MEWGWGVGQIMWQSCLSTAWLLAQGMPPLKQQASAGRPESRSWKETGWRVEEWGEEIQTSLSSHQPGALQVMGLGQDIPVDKGAGGEVEVPRRCRNTSCSKETFLTGPTLSWLIDLCI